MTVTSSITAEPRKLLGTANARRLRQQGLIPGNVYGLNEQVLAVTLAAETVKPVIVSGAHVVDLDVGGNVSKAIIREVQWDTFYSHILHIDLQRIDPNARVDVEVAIEPRGILNEGVLDQLVRGLTLTCLVYQIPEKIVVRVGAMKIGDQITASQLELPEGATCNLPGDTLVFRVHAAQEVEIVQAEATAAEPEVIGRKKAEEEEGAE